MDKKRIIILILFSALVLVIGWLLYIVFFAPAPSPDQPTTPTTPLGDGAFPTIGDAGDRTVVDGQQDPDRLPEAGDIISGGQGLAPFQQTISQIVSSPVKSVGADNNGNLRYYNQQDGKFYKLDDNGNLKLLSDDVFFSASDVTWSPADDKAIVEYPDGSNIFYDFENKKQVTLPKHWEDFSFSSQGEKIAAKSITLAPENRWLITSDPDGQNTILVEPMGLNADKVIVDWSPNKQVIALSKTGQSLGASRQEILMVGQYGENFKSLVVEGRGIVSEWSPSGNKLLYSVHSQRTDFKPELWIVNSSGESIGSGRKVLNIERWADKCTFDEGDRFIYCGVPTELKGGAGFAPQIADGTPDKLYKIDTQTGLKSEIPTDKDYTVDSLSVSGDGTKLYITDKNKDGIFSIDI